MPTYSEGVSFEGEGEGGEAEMINAGLSDSRRFLCAGPSEIELFHTDRPFREVLFGQDGCGHLEDGALVDAMEQWPLPEPPIGRVQESVRHVLNKPFIQWIKKAFLSSLESSLRASIAMRKRMCRCRLGTYWIISSTWRN